MNSYFLPSALVWILEFIIIFFFLWLFLFRSRGSSSGCPVWILRCGHVSGRQPCKNWRYWSQWLDPDSLCGVLQPSGCSGIVSSERQRLCWTENWRQVIRCFIYTPGDGVTVNVKPPSLCIASGNSCRKAEQNYLQSASSLRWKKCQDSVKQW